MNAGSLTEKIIIQRTEITKDDFGANQLMWVNHISTRANVQYSSGNRQNDNNEIIHVYQVIFVIRLYHDVIETDRILYDGKLYRILSVEKDKKRQRISIKTELINE